DRLFGACERSAATAKRVDSAATQELDVNMDTTREIHLRVLQVTIGLAVAGPIACSASSADHVSGASGSPSLTSNDQGSGGATQTQSPGEPVATPPVGVGAPGGVAPPTAGSSPKAPIPPISSGGVPTPIATGAGGSISSIGGPTGAAGVATSAGGAP